MELSIRFRTRIDWKKRVSESSVRSPPEFEKVVSPYSSCNMAYLHAFQEGLDPYSSRGLAKPIKILPEFCQTVCQIC
jgi:hypothetical protein